MVIFCKKTAGKLAFRAATEEDMLKSYARQEFLVPKHEVDAEAFLQGEEGEQKKILQSNDTEVVTQSHKTSARGHWAIMRTVLPGVVWEKW